MSRSKFDFETRQWVSPEEYEFRRAGRAAPVKRSGLTMPNIMRDIQPYKSMIDGRMITSRSHHRQHLRDNNAVEVGNEKPKPRTPPKRTYEQKRASVEQMKAIARQKGIDVL